MNFYLYLYCGLLVALLRHRHHAHALPSINDAKRAWAQLFLSQKSSQLKVGSLSNEMSEKYILRNDISPKDEGILCADREWVRERAILSFATITMHILRIYIHELKWNAFPLWFRRSSFVEFNSSHLMRHLSAGSETVRFRRLMCRI